MARKTIIVCDVCESATQVRAWEVKDKASGSKKSVELCITHSAPFARLFDNGGETETEAPAPARRGGRRRTQPTTLEEIERSKATE